MEMTKRHILRHASNIFFFFYGRSKFSFIINAVIITITCFMNLENNLMC